MDKNASPEKILVSACLLGEACRYDGKGKKDEKLMEKLKNYEIVPFCPEVEGGLKTPRLPAERRGERVIREDNKDVTDAFINGAEKALALCKREGIKKAVLKSKSPSCGVREIYDGTFSKRLVTGRGITAELLEESGIEIFDEEGFKKGRIDG